MMTLPPQIATADLHLSASVPSARKATMTVEEWLDHQSKVLAFIAEQSRMYKAEVLVVGDIAHSPKQPESIMALFMHFVNACYGKVRITYGNHDMYKREASLSKTFYEALREVSQKSSKLECMDLSTDLGPIRALPYTEDPYDSWKFETCEVQMVHTLCYKDKTQAGMTPEGTYIMAKDLMALTKAKYTVVGDMHKAFLYQEAERYLINCGTPLQRTLDDRKRDPVIWLIDADCVQPIPVPLFTPIQENARKAIYNAKGELVALLENFRNSDSVKTPNFEKNTLDGLTSFDGSIKMKGYVTKWFKEATA